MLIVVLLLSFVLGYLSVVALRSSDQPWHSHELFWSLLIGLGITSWLGQALADLGWFSLIGLLAVLGGSSALLLVRGRARVLPRGLVIRGHVLATLGAILALGIALFRQPIEIPLGSRDDGTRLFAGTVVARNGGWLAHMPIPDTLPRVPGLASDIKYVGIEEWNAARDLSILQFTGAYEVWQAIAYGWPSGDPAAPIDISTAHPWMFYLNTVFALVALLGCFVLGRELFGTRAALIGTLLLTINLAQVWYARQTMSEVLLQALLLGGIAASVAYVRAPSRATALAVGLTFGVALLTKVDTLIALVALGATAFVVWPRRSRWPYLGWLIGPLVLIGTQYVVHSIWFSGTYFSYNLAGLATDVRGTLALAVAASVAGALLVLRLQPRVRNWLNRWLTTPIAVRWRVAGLIGLLLLAGYAYFVRPAQLAQEGYVHPLWQEFVPTYRGLNLPMLVAYLTPLGFALAAIGLVRFVLRDIRWHHLPFLSVALAYSLIFTYNAMIAGDQPFWVRRFLPVVIPCALLLAGTTIAQTYRLRSRRRWSAPILLAGTIGWSLWHTAPVAAIRTNTLGAQLADLAEVIPANAVVLFQDWQAAFSVAAPLDLVYKRESYQLNGQPYSGETEQRWRAQIEAWQRAGRPIVYVATDGRVTLPPTDLDWQPLAEQTIQYTNLETTHGKLPQAPSESIQRLQLYRVVAAPQPTPGCAAHVEVGGDDYGAIGGGFYDSETLGDREVRWSTGEANVVLPALRGSGDLLIQLTASDSRPAQAPAATIRFKLGDQLIAAAPVVDGWHTYEVRVPATLIAPETPQLLTWQVDAWSPQTYQQPDARELGVLVDAFSAQRATCQP